MRNRITLLDVYYWETQMKGMRPAWILAAALAVGAVLPDRVEAAGVPIAGFSPQVGLTLTNKFKTDDDPSFTFYYANQETSLTGTQFGSSGLGGTPYYDVALIDTGAGASLITTSAEAAYHFQSAGFRGTHTQELLGATGSLFATVNDPMAMFVTGLGNRTTSSPLSFSTANPSIFKGQSSVSLLTLPPESDLPSVVGFPLASRYATYIRNDQPQIFTVNNRTVRAPQILFNALGSGGQGITRQAELHLQSSTGAAFTQPPAYVFDFNNILDDVPLTEHPQFATLLQEPGAMFVNADVAGPGGSLTNQSFFLDTGADVTVVSPQNALALGFNLGVTPADFTVQIIGSGGGIEGVPGFFANSLTIPMFGSPTPVTVTHVPILVLSVPNPLTGTGEVGGILGTNVLSGRNIVIDPNTSAPRLYVGDPVTTAHDWSSAAASGSWSTSSNWSAAGTPANLWIANVRNTTATSKEAVVSADSTVWELNVSASGAGTMKVRVQAGARLTTFSGVNIEALGHVQLDGGTLDAQFVDIRGGGLSGFGTIMTGSGEIPGQVENRSGTVTIGGTSSTGQLNIVGRYSNGHDGTLAVELGGLAAGTGYDQLVVTGGAALDGTLAVALVNGPAFTPAVGNVFHVLTATDEVIGEFAHLTLPVGYNWRVEINPNSVDVIVGLPGDYNDNGIVDAADYTVWRNTLGSMTVLDADGNGNGQIDNGDFTVWKSTFGAVEPGSGLGSGTVPEPASIGLVLLAALIARIAAPRRAR